MNELESMEISKGEDIEVSDLSDDDDETVVPSSDGSVPDPVKVYYFMLNDVKVAIKIAEKMNIHESQGTASAQLDNLKTV